MVPPPPRIYPLSLHDALPISNQRCSQVGQGCPAGHGTEPGLQRFDWPVRSEEHTSELQSLRHLVCRLLLEKKKKQKTTQLTDRQHINRHYTHISYYTPDEATH